MLLLAGGLSTVRPAPLWLFSEFSAIYKYSDVLTYLFIAFIIIIIIITNVLI